MKTQTTHTPGQWETGALITQVEIWPTGWNVPMLIADCHGKHSPEAEGERVANARLIAAAPDLLGSLESLVEWLDNCFPREAETEVVQTARKAIAKATGQPEGVER